MTRNLFFAAILFAIGQPAICIADQDLDEARIHYKKGTKLYDLGRYLEAAKEYELAFEAKDEGELLFDIAQALRLGKDYPNAVRFYHSYLRREPNTPNRKEVEERISDLEKQIAAQSQAQKTQPQVAAPVPAKENTSANMEVKTPPPMRAEEGARQRTMRTAGIALIATGVVGVVLGGVFVGLAKSADDGVYANNKYHPASADRRDAFQAADVACFVIGGAAVVTGATLFVLGRRESKKTASLTPLLYPAGMAIDVRF
jgi:tetratricopeptide (TPR) repeat protein